MLDSNVCSGLEVIYFYLKLQISLDLSYYIYYRLHKFCNDRIRSSSKRRVEIGYMYFKQEYTESFMMMNGKLVLLLCKASKLVYKQHNIQRHVTILNIQNMHKYAALVMYERVYTFKGCLETAQLFYKFFTNFITTLNLP